MPEALAASRGEAATDAEKLARVRLIHSENVGPVTFRKLLAGYGSAIRALAALPDLARRGGGRTPRIAPAGDAEREIAAVARFGAVHLHIGLPSYPPLLAAIEDAPLVLAVKGRLDLLDRPSRWSARATPRPPRSASRASSPRASRRAARWSSPASRAASTPQPTAARSPAARSR